MSQPRRVDSWQPAAVRVPIPFRWTVWVATTEEHGPDPGSRVIFTAQVMEPHDVWALTARRAAAKLARRIGVTPPSWTPR